MIQEFVQAFETHRAELEAGLRASPPTGYADLVKRVVSIFPPNAEGEQPDPERIHEINDGHYQGTLLFVIGERGYQPSVYWSVAIFYGSCSGCDTFERIGGYGDAPPNDEQVKDYMTLMLHIVQKLTQIDDPV